MKCFLIPQFEGTCHQHDHPAQVGSVGFPTTVPLSLLPCCSLCRKVRPTSLRAKQLHKPSGPLLCRRAVCLSQHRLAVSLTYSESHTGHATSGLVGGCAPAGTCPLPSTVVWPQPSQDVCAHTCGPHAGGVWRAGPLGSPGSRGSLSSLRSITSPQVVRHVSSVTRVFQVWYVCYNHAISLVFIPPGQRITRSPAP